MNLELHHSNPNHMDSGREKWAGKDDEGKVEGGVGGGGDESREAGKSKWRVVEENEGEKEVQIAVYRE